MSPRPPYPHPIVVAVAPELLPTLSALRVVLVTDDEARARDAARVLGHWGARVAHGPTLADALTAGADLDAHALLIDPSRIVLRKGELREQLLLHPRAAWARVLRWRLRDLVAGNPPEGGLAGLVRRLSPLVEPDRTVAGLARHGRCRLFPVPIAQIGPARTLRALAGGRGLLRISAVTTEARASVEVQSGCVRSALYEDGRSGARVGQPAVDAFLRMAPGTGFVEREGVSALLAEGVPVSLMMRDAA